MALFQAYAASWLHYCRRHMLKPLYAITPLITPRILRQKIISQPPDEVCRYFFTLLLVLSIYQPPATTRQSFLIQLHFLIAIPE
jgi:hypothetical protein